MNDDSLALQRIAVAAERIAAALEDQRRATGEVIVRLDGKTIAREVLQQTLRRAAGGPSSLVGGSLGGERK